MEQLVDRLLESRPVPEDGPSGWDCDSEPSPPVCHGCREYYQGSGDPTLFGPADLAERLPSWSGRLKRRNFGAHLSGCRLGSGSRTFGSGYCGLGAEPFTSSSYGIVSLAPDPDGDRSIPEAGRRRRRFGLAGCASREGGSREARLSGSPPGRWHGASTDVPGQLYPPNPNRNQSTQGQRVEPRCAGPG